MIDPEVLSITGFYYSNLKRLCASCWPLRPNDLCVVRLAAFTPPNCIHHHLTATTCHVTKTGVWDSGPVAPFIRKELSHLWTGDLLGWLRLVAEVYELALQSYFDTRHSSSRWSGWGITRPIKFADRWAEFHPQATDFPPVVQQEFHRYGTLTSLNIIAAFVWWPGTQVV